MSITDRQGITRMDGKFSKEGRFYDKKTRGRKYRKPRKRTTRLLLLVKTGRAQ